MSIIADKIDKTFGNPGVNVLKGISFNIEKGEFVSLLGKSGSGKSTLLYILSTLDPSTSGTLTIDNQMVSQFDEKSLHLFRNTKMGFVFQFHYLLSDLTAIENVLMPSLKLKKTDKRDKAMALLEGFGLKEKANRLPRQLSGGEQQRVAIARALIMEPEYLFADEPTGNLDSVNGELVMKILKDINASQGTTIVLVTHDTDFADMAHRKITLVDGMIRSDEKVKSRPEAVL